MRMRQAVGLTLCVLAASFVFLARRGNNLEENFFAHPPDTRLERLRQYSLEDQYKIFRYGNDTREPPTVGLAKAIAERGSSAVPFLVGKLNAKPSDLAVRDILQIFETMTNSGSYDVGSDTTLMTTLRNRVTEMRDKEWQAICQKMLQRITDHK